MFMLSKRASFIHTWYCSKSLCEHCVDEKNGILKRPKGENQARKWKNIASLMLLGHVCVIFVVVAVTVFFLCSALRRTMNYKRNYISSKVTEFGFYELLLVVSVFLSPVRNARAHTRITRPNSLTQVAAKCFSLMTDESMHGFSFSTKICNKYFTHLWMKYNRKWCW